jgi:Transposase DDE domain
MMVIRPVKQDLGEPREINLPYPRELAPFVQRAPLPVLVRSCLEWLIDQAALEQLFEDTAEDQYTREITLTFLVDLMLDVACGIQPSAGAALKARREMMDASRQAFYGKLKRMEPAISAAVVRRVAELAEAIIGQLGATQAEPILGYRARVVDGSVLGGRSEHRIKPLRATKSAGLTCMVLAVYAPAQQVIRQVILEEDAYTQERACLDRLHIEAGEIWIADRNFCVRSFLFRVHRAQSTFLIRWHGSSCPFQESEPLHRAAKTKRGVLQQHVWLEDPTSGEWLQVRRLVLPLQEPTRNGDTELILITDLPDTVEADDLCDVYRDRWQIEVHYQRLTEQLHCEPSGLDYPRAALFAFAMSVTAANALAVVQKALQAQHGEEAMRELSYYQVVLEIAQTWKGMAIVMPTEKWAFVRNFTLEKLAAWLEYVSRLVPIDHFRRSRRGPKKPQPKRQSGKRHQHVSNKRLLDQAIVNSAC